VEISAVGPASAALPGPAPGFQKGRQVPALRQNPRRWLVVRQNRPVRGQMPAVPFA